MPVTVRIHGGVADVPPAAWDALHDDADSPFVEWEWLAALEQSGCATAERGWLPQCFTVWRDGLLVAAAPGYIKNQSEGEFVFDHAWAGAARRVGVEYYPKLVFAVPFTPATGPRVLVAPGEDRVEMTRAVAEAATALVEKLGLSSAHVLFPPEGEARAWTDAGWVERYGVQFHWHRRGETTFEEFLKRFATKRRTSIRRERAQVERDGDTIETLRGDAITPAMIDPMFAFYRSTIEKFYWGRQYLSRAFFERVVERFRHRLEWVVARDRSGQPIAGAFNLRRGATLYGRYWGATVDRRFLHFNVCFYRGIEECLERGIDTFEPGAGGEHKRARGFEPTITRSAHHIADGRLDRAIREYLERERRDIREWVASNAAGDDP